MKSQYALNVTVVDFGQTDDGVKERRKAERIALHNFIDVKCRLGVENPIDARLVDISAEGCKLRIYRTGQEFQLGGIAVIPARFSFGEGTSITMNLYVIETRTLAENGKQVLNVGCVIDKTAPAYAVYEQFLRFVEAYAAHAERELTPAEVRYL